MQPDTIIPYPANPQSWNRYSYVGNNPVNFNDPTGHYGCGDGADYECGHESQIVPIPAPNITSINGGNGNNDGGEIVSALPNGDVCTVVISSCTINTTNSASYIIGAGGSIRAGLAGFNLSSTIIGNQLRIYGTQANREILGINPYTNNMLISNASTLSNASNGAWASVGSPWTWLGIGTSVLADTYTWSNGDYTTSQYEAAVIVDVATGLISATIGGAVAGGLVGTFAGFTAGMGFGAVPGFVAGVAIGALAGAGSYFYMNSYKNDMINIMAPGIDVALNANSYNNPYSGILHP